MVTMKTLLTIVVALAAQVALGGTRQSAEQPPTAFEVVSVKPSASLEPGGLSVDPRQLIVRNLTLREIILMTYGLRSYQLVGGPDWITTARFDIIARAPENVPRNATMSYTLLADRFKLRTHIETRQLPIYALVLARADKRTGPELKTADPGSTRGGNFVAGRIRFRASTMADLAVRLTSWAGRPVTDRTGLTGSYDGELMWTPDLVQPGAPTDPKGAPIDGPSLFTALEEQLGLKLEPAVGPVEVTVIDSVERPTAD